jgi:hypothetical protein
MCKRTLSTLLIPLFAVFVLSGCGAGNDQPQVEKLDKTAAEKKQVMDEALRTRQRTTQIDR